MQSLFYAISKSIRAFYNASLPREQRCKKARASRRKPAARARQVAPVNGSEIIEGSRIPRLEKQPANVVRVRSVCVHCKKFPKNSDVSSEFSDRDRPEGTDKGEFFGQPARNRRLKASEYSDVIGYGKTLGRLCLKRALRERRERLFEASVRAFRVSIDREEVQRGIRTSVGLSKERLDTRRFSLENDTEKVRASLDASRK